jgi:YidC/Oxa1 family membrane protein insertase
MLWSDLVDLLRALFFGVAHVTNGSLGVAVILVTLAIRLALLPLTLRLARRGLAHQRRLAELRPELERLQRRYAEDPVAQMRETSAFFRNRGVKQVDTAALLGALAQAPVFATLYSALRRGLGAGVRFLWIGDTSLANSLITIIVSGVTAASIAAAPSVDPGRTAPLLSLILAAGFTVWFLSSSSALFALSAGTGSVVQAVQGLLLRREMRAAKKA